MNHGTREVDQGVLDPSRQPLTKTVRGTSVLPRKGSLFVQRLRLATTKNVSSLAVWVEKIAECRLWLLTAHSVDRDRTNQRGS